MSYQERCKLYEQIESIRKRHLIAYVTSSRENDGGGRMGSDVIAEFCDQIEKIPDSEKNIDILIVSNGGDPIVAWRIITLLRERFESVGVLVPFSANSAATLLSLGADEIIMHPYANFGPVDPQITVLTNDGMQRQFSVDYLKYYLDFVKNEAGMKEEEEIGSAFQHLCEKVNALDIGMARKSSKLTESLGIKLLLTHMDDVDKAGEIAKQLNESFYHHGYTIGRTEAKSLGLPITDASNELEQLIWGVWCDFEKEMKCRIPFDPLTEILTTEEYTSRLGISTGKGITKDTYNSLFSAISDGGSYNFELMHAAVESLDLCCTFVSVKQFNIIKTPDLKLNHQYTPINNGYWRKE